MKALRRSEKRWPLWPCPAPARRSARHLERHEDKSRKIDMERRTPYLISSGSLLKMLMQTDGKSMMKTHGTAEIKPRRPSRTGCPGVSAHISARRNEAEDGDGAHRDAHHAETGDLADGVDDRHDAHVQIAAEASSVLLQTIWTRLFVRLMMKPETPRDSILPMSCALRRKNFARRSNIAFLPVKTG